ncbi:hypothetical protein V2J09_022842 [Rumex salicifolius]
MDFGRIDHTLISAFVELWYSETNSFHFLWGSLDVVWQEHFFHQQYRLSRYRGAIHFLDRVKSYMPDRSRPLDVITPRSKNGPANLKGRTRYSLMFTPMWKRGRVAIYLAPLAGDDIVVSDPLLRASQRLRPDEHLESLPVPSI